MMGLFLSLVFLLIKLFFLKEIFPFLFFMMGLFLSLVFLLIKLFFLKEKFGEKERQYIPFEYSIISSCFEKLT